MEKLVIYKGLPLNFLTSTKLTGKYFYRSFISMASGTTLARMWKFKKWKIRRKNYNF